MDAGNGVNEEEWPSSPAFICFASKVMACLPIKLPWNVAYLTEAWAFCFLSSGLPSGWNNRSSASLLSEEGHHLSPESFVKALTWHGKNDLRCETMPDPKIEHPRDAIIKVTACAICGSDLHIFDGVIPQMKRGDVLGHETMGEVVEVGSENKKLKVGDRVVVPFTIACGECFFCQRGYFSGCERTNPDHEKAAKLWGNSPAGLFGYSHLLGGYAGGQAEYLRVPYADVGPLKVPDGLSDEQVLFLSDIFPTGYMGAEFCDLKGGETVAIWGCGPVGQFA